MTAGPTPLPPAVSQVMAEPMTYHRAPAFVEVYARVLRRLKDVFQTRNEVQVFTSSGTGALESAVANLVKPGEPVLVASCGKFGERWFELSEAYGAETIHWETEWGRKIDPAGLDERLAAHPTVELVFTTYSETSTGVVNDVRELTEVAHRHDTLIAVDAVSGLGAVPLPQEEWGVDVVVAGSQKALMAPPGPAVGLIKALDIALGMIEEEGLEQVYERHALLGRATREAARALDLDLLGGVADENANVVTAIALPDSIDGGKVPKIMRERFGITIAGGQGKLKGRIARIAHCGYFGAFDIIVTISALEMTLRELGHEAEPGAGVAAAQRVFSDAGIALHA